jgi:triosephosphate isomerase
VKLIVGNWKMNKTAAEAAALAAALRQRLAGVLSAPGCAEVVLCPPFTALHAVRDAVAGSALRLGAQDVHWEGRGAFTGEISGPMLVDAGCDYVIVGHSERRRAGEGDEAVARKVRAALDCGLLPIVCVGETLDERLDGLTAERLTSQVQAALEGLPADELRRCTVAYEPIWAIGTGRAATPEDATSAAAVVRAAVPGVGAGLRILYGGSVTPVTAPALWTASGVDGALVGGASLDADLFADIVLSAQAS